LIKPKYIFEKQGIGLSNILKMAFIILLLLSSSTVYCQCSNVKLIETTLPNQFADFDKIKFIFNGIEFFGSEKGIFEIEPNIGFDNGIAVIKNDTLKFKLKFKANENYVLKAGCCCSAFILVPEQNARRGTVELLNKFKKNLNIILAEANFDTIEVNSIKTPIFAFESAMCRFKPASILITELEYNDQRFKFTNNDKLNKSLSNKRKTFILYENWFHFLHGEKIELVFDQSRKNVKMNLLGYLTEKEIKKFYKE